MPALCVGVLSDWVEFGGDKNFVTSVKMFIAVLLLGISIKVDLLVLAIILWVAFLVLVVLVPRELLSS